MQPFRESSYGGSLIEDVEVDNKPITSFRKFLNPCFDVKKLLISNDKALYNTTRITIPENDYDFNLWDLYNKSFKDFYYKYFKHLTDDDEYDDNDTKIKKYRIRNNLYHDFKLKICLVEDNKVLTHFIKQICFFNEKVEEIYKASLSNDTDYQHEINFWTMFTQNILDLEPKFVLYIVPFNLQNEGKSLNPNLYYTSMLSEHLAFKDVIYQTLIFNPWMVHKESYDISRQKGIISNLEKMYGFDAPNMEDLLSCLKSPLKFYVAEANHQINLNLFSIFNVEEKEKVDLNIFWRCVNINSKLEKSRISLK